MRHLSTLDLTPDMIVRPGNRVIAAEVESRRARAAHARKAVERIALDPLLRASRAPAFPLTGDTHV